MPRQFLIVSQSHYLIQIVGKNSNTVDSRYLEYQGTHWNTSRYPYLDISELREWEKNNKLNNHF